MSEWKKMRLGEIVRINPLFTLKKGVAAKKVAMDKITPHCRDITSYAEESYSGGVKFVNGCTLMARITPCLENGKIAQVRFLGNNEVAFGSTEFIVFQDIEDVSDKDFIYYLINTDLIRQKAIDSMVGSSGRQRAQSDEIAKISIYLPPLPTQRKIAAVLGALDDKIENNRKICANLEAQAQAIFKSWFVDFEPFGGTMPQGWKMGKLEEICSYISRGLTPKYVDSSNELILGQTCVRNNVVSLANARSHQLSKETVKKVHKWDTLINSTGIGSLGRVGIVYFDMPNVAFDSHLTVVRASDSIFNHYLGRNLLNRQSEIENMAVGSTGQTELPRDSVRTMDIIIPTQPVLEQFNEIIEPVGERIYHSLLQNSRLAALRDALLPKLMSGEIDVEKVEVA